MGRLALVGGLLGSFTNLVTHNLVISNQPPSNTAHDAAVGAVVGAGGLALIGLLSKPCGPLPYPWT